MDEELSIVAEKKLRRDIEVAAMNLLARREHARAELETKLKQREFPVDITAEVLDRLTERNLQSDNRFAQSFVRQRVTKGKGEQFIRMELKQRQVSDDDISDAFAENPVDWFELALEAKRKRFGYAVETDRNALSKQQRFLLGRGFSHEQARYAMNAADND